MRYHIATYLTLALLLSACGQGRGVEDSAAETRSGPPLTADEAKMAAALRCPATFSSSRSPVLLVHGTGGSAAVNWESGLLRVLQQQGYDACTVDLPKNSWGDIQFAAEYVVYSAKQMAQRSGRKVSFVAHSQGVMQVNWALKWWPEVAALADDVIGLSGSYHGVGLADSICAPRLCPPSAWQMDYGSEFVAAMNRDDETPGPADYSSLYSMTDGNVLPASSELAGARNIAVQDLCPDREVGHSHMLVDAVALALVLDALGHDGPAVAGRVGPGLCGRDMAEGVDEQRASYQENVGGAIVYGATIASAGLVTSEPPLASYAR